MYKNLKTSLYGRSRKGSPLYNFLMSFLGVEKFNPSHKFLAKKEQKELLLGESLGAARRESLI